MVRTAASPALPANRSAVTNGRRLLLGVDGNSAAYRRYKDLVGGLTQEVGGALTEAEKLQVRNAASLQLHAEELTAKMVRGEEVDPEAISRAANGANRAIAALKRRRIAKPPAPAGAAAYLASKAAAE